MSCANAAPLHDILPDAWFDALQSDLAKTMSAQTQAVRTVPPMLRDKASNYSNGVWAVDADGMTALDGSHDLNISEIFAITSWKSQGRERLVYHMPLHFSLKSRQDLDAFLDCWMAATRAHSQPGRTRMKDDVLQVTIEELQSGRGVKDETLKHLHFYVTMIRTLPPEPEGQPR